MLIFACKYVNNYTSEPAPKQRTKQQQQHSHSSRAMEILQLSTNTTATTTITITSPNCAAVPDDNQTILEAVPVITHGLDGGWFGKISTTLILLFGTFGNVMTVIILRRLRSGWSAMNVYLTALALSDTAMLYSVDLPMWARKVLDYDVYVSHVVVCKLGIWVMTSAANLSTWLLVALTAQRAASVVWPHRVSLICTHQKSVVTIVVITSACGVLQIHTLYGFGLVEFDGGTTARCTFGSVSYQQFWISVWVRVNMFLYSLLPCFFLILCNAILGWKLAAAVKEAKELKFSVRTEDRRNSCRKKTSSVTVTIITVSVGFVIITIPFMIYSNLFYGYVSDCSRSREVHFFLYDFFFVIGLSNFAWNFYLYCLTGSRFREEFKKIVFGRGASVTLATGSAYVTEESQVSEAGSVQKKRDVESNDDF